MTKTENSFEVKLVTATSKSVNVNLRDSFFLLGEIAASQWEIDGCLGMWI